MKIPAEALHDFVSILPHYDRLSASERRSLAAIERPSQTVSALVLGNSLPKLIAEGFLRPALPNGRCPVELHRQEFIRTLRLVRAHPLFQSARPEEAIFTRYLGEHFTAGEKDALRDKSGMVYGDPSGPIYRQISSPNWVENFLNAQDESWELPFLKGSQTLFARPEVLECAQSLVRWLTAHGGRALLRDVIATVPDPAQLSTALHAAMHYLLVFPALDSENMEVIVGLWPAAIPDPPLTGIPEPRRVKPTAIFDPLFLLEDMTALLVACAAEPFPLRSNDGELYAKKVRQLSEILHPLPEWVDEACDVDREMRVKTSLAYLRSFRLVEEKGYSSRTLDVSLRGRTWMDLGLGDRLRVLLDGVLDREQKVPGFESFAGARVGATTARIDVITHVRPKPDIPGALLQVFRSLEGDGFYPLQEIVDHSQMANPLLEIYRKDKNAYFSSGHLHLSRTDAAGLKIHWSETIHSFVRMRLAPLGAVRLGSEGSDLSIAMTPAGRYFLGQAEWQWATASDSQVIVQPNFEVTFLGESPAAEAEIGRFAERRKQRMGALFQITKKSIFAAAMTGMTAEAVLKVLEHICTKEVPGNVRREIQGWFAQCRKVSMEPVIVIRCPDRETALRVQGLAKDSVTPLTETILEYRCADQKQHASLVKKLKEMGVLLQETRSQRW